MGEILFVIQLKPVRQVLPFDWFTTDHLVSGESTFLLGYTLFSSNENFSAYSPVLRGSILLPPRHPSLFARMARWQKEQLTKYICVIPWPVKILECSIAKRELFLAGISLHYQKYCSNIYLIWKYDNLPGEFSTADAVSMCCSHQTTAAFLPQF